MHRHLNRTQSRPGDRTGPKPPVTTESRTLTRLGGLALLGGLLAAGHPVQAESGCAQGQAVSGRYFITTEEVNFRTGPGTGHSRIVNEMASETLGSTQYRRLWPDDALEGRCITDDWLQGQLVEIDGQPVEGPTGWVHRDYVSATASESYRAGLVWNIEGDQALPQEDKANARRGALAVLRQIPDCARVTTGYRSFTRGGGFFVTCMEKNSGLPFNVRFTVQEPDGDISIKRPGAYPRTASRQLCHNRIRMTVANPGSLELDPNSGYSNQALDNGNRIVLQKFSTPNMMGAQTSYQAECLILPNGEIKLTVYETAPPIEP